MHIRRNSMPKLAAHLLRRVLLRQVVTRSLAAKYRSPWRMAKLSGICEIMSSPARTFSVYRAFLLPPNGPKSKAIRSSRMAITKVDQRAAQSCLPVCRMERKAGAPNLQWIQTARVQIVNPSLPWMSKIAKPFSASKHP